MNDSRNSQKFNFKGASGVTIGSIKQGSCASGPIVSSEPAGVLERPRTILFLGANPVGTSPLRLDLEVRAIDESLRAAPLGSRFRLEQVWAAGYFDVQEALLRLQPDLVHFSGHGSSDGELAFETAAERNLSILLPPSTGEQLAARGRPPSIAALSRLFSLAGGKVRCVVLNACFSETQARGIAENIGCVIGMENPIKDTSAIRFARGFYQALASGLSVKVAFDLGCTQLNLGDRRDRATPRLFSANVDPSGLVLTERSLSEPADSP